MYKKEWARDIRYRRRMKDFELLIKIKKYLSNNNNRIFKYTTHRFLKRKMSRYGYSILVRRCIFSGRPRGLISDFGISRHRFKQLVEKGLFSGITKSSW